MTPSTAHHQAPGLLGARHNHAPKLIQTLGMLRFREGKVSDLCPSEKNDLRSSVSLPHTQQHLHELQEFGQNQGFTGERGGS